MMQSLRDAGVVLVVILLLASVRLSPLDETGQAADTASLTPQVEAATAPSTFDATQIDRGESAVAANAVVVSTSDEFSIREWVLNDGDEIVHSAEIEAEAIEQCTEVLIHIRKSAEETRNKTIVLGAEEVVKVLPCSV